MNDERMKAAIRPLFRSETALCMAIDLSRAEYNAIESEVQKEQAENIAALKSRIAELEAQLAAIEQKLFISRWNGVIDGGSKTTWHIAPDYRHTTAKMVGHTFAEAIENLLKD